MICRIPGASFVVGDVMGYLDCLLDCHRGANNMHCTVYCYMIGSLSLSCLVLVTVLHV